jgi:hypothetical protein
MAHPQVHHQWREGVYQGNGAKERKEINIALVWF